MGCLKGGAAVFVVVCCDRFSKKPVFVLRDPPGAMRRRAVGRWEAPGCHGDCLEVGGGAVR